MNPDWVISLWNDAEGKEKSHLQRWCDEQGILFRSIHDSIQWGSEKKIVYDECHNQFYVTASDMLRLRVLYQCGGFYVDFDVVPRVLPKGALPLGIAMLLRKKSDQLSSVLPHAIASYPGHPLLQMALWEAEINFDLLEHFPDQDYRTHEDPSYRYGIALALTGDLFRPALALCAGVFPMEGFSWTPWLDVMQMGIEIVHLEDNSWLNGDRPSQRVYPELYMAAKAERLKQQRRRSLTSILHLAAAYGSVDLIEHAIRFTAPFEDYFGFSPQGVAQRYQRGQDIINLIPSL